MATAIDRPEGENAVATRPVLIVGVPRSGTTWLGEALGRTRGVSYVNEPDNHVVEPYAFAAKRGLGSFPALNPGDRSPAYERLWQDAFDGRVHHDTRGRSFASRAFARAFRGSQDGSVVSDVRLSLPMRAAASLAGPARVALPGRLVMKSVYVCLCLRWLVALHQPSVILVRRHPLDVVASWLELGYLDVPGLRPPSAEMTQVERVAWFVAVLTSALEEAATSLPEVATVHHARLCEDPVARVQSLAGELGLVWDGDAECFLRSSDRAGSGWSLERVAADQHERWRARLSEQDAASARAVLERFPLVAPLIH